MVRRHLGMGWGEWRALPWWEQRVLGEGLQREFSGEPGAAPQAHDTTHTALDGTTPGEFRAQGFTERNL